MEVLTTYLKETVRKMGKDHNLVRGYRGGYLPTERRDIEKMVVLAFEKGPAALPAVGVVVYLWDGDALAGSSNTLWLAQPMAISTGVNMLDNSNEWFIR